MPGIVVRQARITDTPAIGEMAVLLWPEASVEKLRQEFESDIRFGMCGTLPAAVFVAESEVGSLRGFLQVGLRSHADGCDVSRPVGYVEGWFVREESRHQGIGKALMSAAEDWSRQQGCREMASDTWVIQEESIRAHQKLGFEVVDRCVHFRKGL